MKRLMCVLFAVACAALGCSESEDTPSAEDTATDTLVDTVDTETSSDTAADTVADGVDAVDESGEDVAGDSEPDRIPAGGSAITYIHSEGIGRIAVQIELPETPRYPEGAPVVVHASTFFAGGVGFHRKFDSLQVGAIAVSYNWTGRIDPHSGAESEGFYDHGGPISLAAFRDVIRFASGVIPNVDGHYLGELVELTPLLDNVGIFASSHSGIVATNVLAIHGQQLRTVKYLVGRENPTRDEMYPLEIGYFDDDRNAVQNPFYNPDAYTPTTIEVNYASVGWYHENPGDPGRPYHAALGGIEEHLLHPEICPVMFDKRFYSRAIIHALEDNGALTPGVDWPDDLATPDEADEEWSIRLPVDSYDRLAEAVPDLKVMLVFAKKDHVQAALDKPHIHQAYDGFHENAGYWIRLNPDLAYIQAVEPSFDQGYPDNDANTEPPDWMDSRQWGFPSTRGLPSSVKLVPMAGVAEMADRVREDNWTDDNLDQVLVSY